MHSEKRNKKPNILWLMSDQHNAACLSICGHPDVQTPHLDQLAQSGIRFDRAYCNNPICGPSRSCFLTGQTPKTHGITGNYIRNLRSDAPNLATTFRQEGYQTGLIGKAHLPKAWIDAGFEHQRLCDMTDAAPEDPRSCHYFDYLVRNGLGDAYDLGNRKPGQTGAGFNTFISEIPQAHCLETWTGNEAIDFLEQRDCDRPFFLKVSFQRPHEPYSPSAEDADRYDADSITVPDSACDYFYHAFSGKPRHHREHIQQPKGSGYPYRSYSREALKLQMARHFTLISMIDDQIGRIVEQLKASGDYDNTIIAYVADHGDFAGEHGLVLKNLGIYESIHRIPFILAGPHITPCHDSETFVESIDFFPTLCDLAGIHDAPQTEGLSLTSALQGTELPHRSHVTCEWDFYDEPQRQVYAIRTPAYRFVHYTTRPDDGELYDCIQDPDELENRFHDPSLAGEKARFLQMIEAYQVQTRRIHTPADDAPLIEKDKDQPTRLIVTGDKTWSQLAELCPN